MRVLISTAILMGCILASVQLVYAQECSPLPYFTSKVASNDAISKAFLKSLEQPELQKLKAFYRRPSFIPLRPNKVANVEAALSLGKILFFDPRLSKSNLISCATCHNPGLNWTDSLSQSVEGNSRRTMSLVNLAWDKQFTWHGKAGSLMSQAILALTAPKGMNSNLPELAQELKNISGYQKLFNAAYGGVVPKQYEVSPDTITFSIELFVSSLVSCPAPFDRWIEGKEDAMSRQAKEGFWIFNTKAQCARCHNTWKFSDGSKYDIGMNVDNSEPTVFKSVGLRNIAERPPYMHSGAYKNLTEVIEFYNRGGDVQRPTKSNFIHPLNLSNQEKEQLLAFLESLTSKNTPVSVPVLPR